MISRTILRIVATLIIECTACRVLAYETPTHSEITNRAIDQSVLVNTPELLNELGIGSALDQTSFPGEVPVDEHYPVPEKTFYLSHAPIRRIIKAGAVLEDRGRNSLHHFYDPRNDGRGLVLGAGAVLVHVGIPSPDWMLETGDSALSGLFRQDFSYGDTVGYFYKALTMNRLADRKLNSGLMFRGIGHLVHHIQDMAQPQHVRNDQHCDASVAVFCRLADNPSHFEKYTDKNRKAIIGGTASYAIPAFPVARQFWLNTNGAGLAGFTQSNFISDGTNFDLDNLGTLAGNRAYPLPAPLIEQGEISFDLLTALQLAAVDPDDISEIMRNLQCDVPLVCEMQFIASNVIDPDLTGSDAISMNPRASTISLLDDELQSRELRGGISPGYNRLNFHAAYPFLMPRAIAYSAGMINHFFRGRLSIDSAEVDMENNVVIAATNRSVPGNTFMTGSFELYYESVSEGRKRVPELGISSGGLPLIVGASLQLTATVPDDVNDEIDTPYLLVYNAQNGRLGEETGIAASIFDISITGEVVWLSRNANLCPERTYGVAIAFAEQPENGGRVVLQGKLSGARFDFTSVPSGTEVFLGGARWSHKIDPFSGKYMYEVSYRYPGTTANPCTSPWLDAWIQDEKVLVLPASQ